MGCDCLWVSLRSLEAADGARDAFAYVGPAHALHAHYHDILSDSCTLPLQSVAHMEAAAALLRQYQPGSELLHDVEGAVLELQPQLALGLLALPLGEAPAQRSRGLALAESVLRGPATRERGLAGPAARADFLKQLAGCLTAAEQVAGRVTGEGGRSRESLLRAICSALSRSCLSLPDCPLLSDYSASPPSLPHPCACFSGAV